MEAGHRVEKTPSENFFGVYIVYSVNILNR